jgi:hypothetical protein
LSVITDQHVLDEIAERFKEFYFEAIAAPDITVDKDHPLIINTTGTLANYGTVTVVPGGYIQISVDCSFTAVRMVKSAPSRSAAGDAAHDIIITADPGRDGNAGAPGSPAMWALLARPRRVTAAVA